MKSVLSKEHAPGGHELDEELLSDLDKRRAELQSELSDLLASGDPLELLMQFAIPYLTIDPNTYRESEMDQLAPHVEYLTMLILGLDMWPAQAWDLREFYAALPRVKELIQEIFELHIRVTALEDKRNESAGHSAATDLRRQTLLRSLLMRAPAHIEHELANLQGIFSSRPNLMTSKFGFTIEEAIQIVGGVERHMMEPYLDRLDRADQEVSELRREIKLARRKPKRYFEPHVRKLAKLSPSESNQWLQTMAVVQALDGAKSTFAISTTSLAAFLQLPVATVQAFFEAFTVSPAAYDPSHHRFPAPTGPPPCHDHSLGPTKAGCARFRPTFLSPCDPA